jgi:amino-acid N-acetyltransferase
MIRKARLDDVKAIKRLIDFYANKKLILKRSFMELYENIRDFFVYEENGKVKGCCALHIWWEGMAEIRSLVVDKSKSRKGIGRALMGSAIEEAKSLQIKQVFALTRIPSFFKKVGFKKADRKKLSYKVWSECIKCPDFPECDEVAMVYTIKG